MYTTNTPQTTSSPLRLPTPNTKPSQIRKTRLLPSRSPQDRASATPTTASLLNSHIHRVPARPGNITTTTTTTAASNTTRTYASTTATTTTTATSCASCASCASRRARRVPRTTATTDSGPNSAAVPAATYLVRGGGSGESSGQGWVLETGA